MPDIASHFNKFSHDQKSKNIDKLNREKQLKEQREREAKEKKRKEEQSKAALKAKAAAFQQK